MNINSIHYDPDNFQFLPDTYLESPDTWKPVVRVIDFDNLQSIE